MSKALFVLDDFVLTAPPALPLPLVVDDEVADADDVACLDEDFDEGCDELDWEYDCVCLTVVNKSELSSLVPFAFDDVDDEAELEDDDCVSFVLVDVKLVSKSYKQGYGSLNSKPRL